MGAATELNIRVFPIDFAGQGTRILFLNPGGKATVLEVQMTSPFLEILVLKLDAQVLYEVLPVGEERRRLSEKIRACEIALSFLNQADRTEEEPERTAEESERRGQKPEIISLPLYNS
jgi:hypothetical protein